MNPNPPHPGPSSPQGYGPPAPQMFSAPVAGVDRPAAPDPLGTVVILVGMMVVFLASAAQTESQVLTKAGWITGVALGISFLLDLRHGLRNMVRADLLALAAIYGLCYAEFLMPDESMQRGYNIANDYDPTKRAVNLVSMAIAAFASARHLTSNAPFTQNKIFVQAVNPMLLIRLFWMCFFFGYLHQWLAVKFNMIEWIEAMLRQRWAQPWGRSHFGDWKALIYELGLLQYVISPLGAIIFVRRKQFTTLTVTLVALAVAMNFFHAFTTGTRHIFFVHVILFTTALCYFQKFTVKMILIAGCTALAIMWVSTNLMLAFRQIGFKRWLHEKSQDITRVEEEQSLYVDMTFQNLNRLVDRVPEVYNYLGFEVFKVAATRPVPRAIWKGKPKGLSTSLEEILFEKGISGTWSVTYIGEAYLAFGTFGIFVVSAAFGVAAGYWNRFGSPLNSDMGILIFASGFFQFSIAMRSLFNFTTAILPTVGLIFLMLWLLRNRFYILPFTQAQKEANENLGGYPQEVPYGHGPHAPPAMQGPPVRQRGQRPPPRI